MADDFYYGRDPGRGERVDHQRRYAGSYRCLHCPENVHNNIQLMSHLKTHGNKMAEDYCRANPVTACPRCFRRFSCPLGLRRHAEAVHARGAPNAKCEICELDFPTEPNFLRHMKSKHKPGEMPYVCQVCDFRSSFYSDVWSHFEEFHANTANLMCPYCLKILRNSLCYMHHFASHQRKFVFSCVKCRLQFLYAKERQQHQNAHHGTHIMPTQLTGLKPGTKVTVRTYSAVAGADPEEPARPALACKVVDVEAARFPQEVPGDRARETLAYLMSSNDSEEDAPARRCVECSKRIDGLSAHFRSRVRCSLCPFATCCATAYANHMIKEHTAARTKPHYHSMFRWNGRLQERLTCATCRYVTCVGDQMAAHLAERPGHFCVAPGACEMPGSHAAATCTSDSPLKKRRVTSSGGGEGAFVPIGLAPARRLSVSLLASPYDPSSPAALTVTFTGPRPPPAQEGGGPRHEAVKSPSPARRTRGAAFPRPRWRSARQESELLAEWEWRVSTWALVRHEQQLRISEDILLRTHSASAPPNTREAERHRRAVRRLCRHLRLGRRLPDKVLGRIMEKSAAFVLSLCSRIRSASLGPGRVGFMDELSVFVDADLFAERDGRAFQLAGRPAQKPVFDVVLSALSDGTFLPPVLFFRGAPAARPADFPDNVLLEARANGFSDSRRLHLWTRKVWSPRMCPYGKSLLITDVHRGHAAEEFKRHLRAAADTDAVLIPAGCSCRLQPLDVCVKPVLFNFLQVRWNHLVARGGLDGLGLDQLALMLACWISELSSTLASDADVLKRSFASVCHLQKERTDGERLIGSLTAKLNVPLEVPKAPPHPPAAQHVDLLLVLHEERRRHKSHSGAAAS